MQMDAEVANELDICSRLLQEGPANALVRPSSAASARGVTSPGVGWEGESHDNVSLKSFRLDQHAEVSMPRLVAFRKPSLLCHPMSCNHPIFTSVSSFKLSLV